MGTARDRAPHSTRPSGLACLKAPRPYAHSFPALTTRVLLPRLPAIPRPHVCHHHPELHLGFVSGGDASPEPRGCLANAAGCAGCYADSVYNPL
jgi:hypothetical protein